MSQFIVVAIGDEEDANEVASSIGEWLAHAGVLREVNVPSDPVAINALKDTYPPAFEDEQS